MKKQKKRYENPLHPWDKERLSSEKELLGRFGLRRKKEIWIAEAVLRKFRGMARDISAEHDVEKEKVLINKMIRLGILNEGATLDDVLGLTVEDILGRRLQTILKTMGLVNTIRQARQVIVHGNVKINDRKIVYPSYIVNHGEENSISVTIPFTVKKPVTEETQVQTTEVKEGEQSNA